MGWSRVVVKIPPSQSVTHCLPRRTKGIIRRGKARKALWVTIKTFLIVRKKKKIRWCKGNSHHLPQTDQSPASLNSVSFGKTALRFYCWTWLYMTLCKHFSAIAKTFLCYQQCFHHKSKMQHHTGCFKEHSFHPNHIQQRNETFPRVLGSPTKVTSCFQSYVANSPLYSSA